MVETFVKGWTAPPHAIVRVALHLVPHFAARQLWKRCQRSVRGVVRPLLNTTEVIAIFIMRKETTLALTGEFEAAQTDIVAAALHQHRTEFFGNHCIEKRNVLLNQLLLQTDGVGSHHYTFAAFHNAPDGRNQIRKALADARPCFDKQSLSLFKRALHRACHQNLLGAHFKAGQSPRDCPGIREQHVNGECHPNGLRFGSPGRRG